MTELGAEAAASFTLEGNRLTFHVHKIQIDYTSAASTHQQAYRSLSGRLPPKEVLGVHEFRHLADPHELTPTLPAPF